MQDVGVPPESPEGLQFAKAYWDMVLEFTDGDADMLPKLMQMGESDKLNQEWKQKQAKANAFIEPALGAYFSRSGINPFQEETT